MMTKLSSHSLVDRRTCLKGVGVSLALPLLDSVGWAKSRRQAPKPPVRLGFMYMPHGVIMDQFWPKSPEAFLKSPPPAIKSLRPVLDQCLMMKGISGVPISPFNGAPHALELSTWLTATLPDASTRSRVNIAISADRFPDRAQARAPFDLAGIGQRRCRLGWWWRGRHGRRRRRTGNSGGL